MPTHPNGRMPIQLKLGFDLAPRDEGLISVFSDGLFQVA